MHGDLKPGNVMVTTNTDGSFGKAMVLDFGFAKERARVERATPRRPARRRDAELHEPGAHPIGRRQPGGRRLRPRPDAPRDVDVPRARARLQAAREDHAPADHVRRPRRAVASTRSSRSSAAFSDDPQQRLPARHLRFFNPVTLTTNPIQVPRERLDPGPPPGRSAHRSPSLRAPRRCSSPSRPTRPSSWAS